MHEYEPKFTLEQEREAFGELKRHLRRMWKENPSYHDQLKEENRKARLYIAENKIKLIPHEFAIKKEFVDLLNKIQSEIINSDPTLSSISIFNSIEPENLSARRWVITKEEISPYHDLLTIDLLKGSGITKIQELILSGVPAGEFVVGQIIGGLLWDFEHFRYIDAVKEAGAEGSIEELRKTRIYQDGGDTVYDYYPFQRRRISKIGITVEVFTEEEFKRAKKDKEEFSWVVDTFLLLAIRQGELDIREAIFFGHKFESRFNYTVRYQGREVSIPLQLMPKWKPKIYSTAAKYQLTHLLDQNRDRDRRNEDGKQEALIGLGQGAFTWDPSKGPATPWLAKHIRKAGGKAADKLSTSAFKEERLEWSAFNHYSGDIKLAREKFKRRILFEDLEKRLLDQPIDDEGTPLGEMFVGSNISQIEDLIDEKRILDKARKNPRIMRIFDEEEKGIAISAKDRQYKSRWISSCKKA